MKSKLFIPITLCSATMLIGSAFAQYSDCLPCQRDQPASPGKACRGSNEYNPETHECCGGKIVEKGKCCRKGGTPTEYDKNSQCCENAGVLPKEEISNLNDCPNRTANGNPPSVDGCSAPIPVAEIFFQTSFTEACNEHDICYSTCRTQKAVCDSNFNTAMDNHCESTYPSLLRTISPAAAEAYESCLNAKLLYYAAVSNAAPADYYIPAQKEVCKCCN